MSVAVVTVVMGTLRAKLAKLRPGAILSPPRLETSSTTINYMPLGAQVFFCGS